MEIASIIGVVLGFLAVGVGMVLKGSSLVALVNPAAILIIIVGTIATIFVGFPMEDIKKVPKLFRILFTKQQAISKVEIVRQFAEWTIISRREGILSLENRIEEIDNDFLKKGMAMAIDGNDADFIYDVLSEDVAAMEARHRDGALIFSQAGTYAPTLGVLGAVVGLISALSNLNEVEALGHLISAAFVATLLGIFTGYVLWHPMANKLKLFSRREAEVKRMMLDGILSIQAGDNVNAIHNKLSVYLSANERMMLAEESTNEKA